MMELEEKIKDLQKRKSTLLYLRKITTQLINAIEYDWKISIIDFKIQQLQTKKPKKL